MKKYIVPLLLLLLLGCTNTEDKQVVQGSSFGESKNQTIFEEVKIQNLLDCLLLKKSGVFYLGFPECPWCEELTPILEKLALETKAQVFYIKSKDDKGNNNFNEADKAILLSYVKDYLEKNDNGESTLYYPFVIVIKNGTIKDTHIGTVDGHNAHERKMTMKERLELYDILKRKINLE